MGINAGRTVETAVVPNILALMTRPKRMAVADARFRQAQLKAAEATLRLAADTRREWIEAVAAWEKVAYLMGPSGSGKTTVLTLLGCLGSVQDGSVRLLGQELNGASEPTLMALRRRLGFIFQAHNRHESLTALQNVMMGLQVHGDISHALALKAAIGDDVVQGAAERICVELVHAPRRDQPLQEYLLRWLQHDR